VSNRKAPQASEKGMPVRLETARNRIAPQQARGPRPDPRGLTFAAVLAGKAREHGDAIFLKYLPDGRRYSYAKWNSLTATVAGNLQLQGIGPGTHVAVMMDNCPEQLLAYFGLARLGAVTVPINTAARGDLLEYLLTHADCHALIVDTASMPFVQEIIDRLPLVRRIIVHDAASTPGRQDDRPDPAADSPPPGRGIPQARFASLLREYDGPPPASPRYSDLAFLMYTSGTTGPSKAIMCSQAHTLYWGWDYALHHGYDSSDTVYVYLPLFHGNAWLCGTLGALMAGASIAMSRRFSASRFWSDVATAEATVTNCLGAVMSFLWARAPDVHERNHKLRRMGVTPIPAFGDRIEARYGVRIMSSYGLTDFCSIACYGPDAPREKLGAAGLPRLGIEIRIVDEHDIDMAAGEPGEIIVRSNNPWGSASGYYKMPEATIESRRNLWFHTGDRGYLDEDGYLYFKDRLKDAIRRRGENISAFEVESAIASHPDVAAVAAYPVRSDSTEDEVAVSVVLAAGKKLAPEALIAHCGRNLAYFMVPRYVEFVGELPINASQKIQKALLKERAEQSLDGYWDKERAGGVELRPTQRPAFVKHE